MLAIKHVKVKTPIDRSIPPVSQPHRQMAISLEEAVDKKLNEFLENNVIEPVTFCTDWVSPMVIISKPNKEICNCIAIS